MITRFCVQIHHSKRPHTDFRLAINGVAKSWCLPKGLPPAMGVSRLAIQVADHTVEYMSWQGEIKEGYGKGTVVITHQGVVHIFERTGDKIVFLLTDGRTYELSRWKGGHKNPKRNWIMRRVK